MVVVIIVCLFLSYNNNRKRKGINSQLNSCRRIFAYSRYYMANYMAHSNFILFMDSRFGAHFFWAHRENIDNLRKGKEKPFPNIFARSKKLRALGRSPKAFFIGIIYDKKIKRALGAAVSAFASHAKGHRFKSSSAHKVLFT